MSSPDVTSGSEHPNTESRSVLERVRGLLPSKKEVDYAKLYEQEKKSNRDLEIRLVEVHGRILDAESRLRSRKLTQALSKDYGEENAQRAVIALIIECEQSLKERQRLDSLVGDYREKIDGMEIDRERETERRVLEVSRLENEKRQLTVDHDRQMARAQAERKTERDRMNASIAQMESDFASKVDQMNSELQSTKYRMEMEFENERVRLKRDIEALNGALVAREHFKPLSDHDLKSLFSDLVIDIDHVARLGWKYNQTTWTEELLAQVAKNPRRIKKNILQESLWISLYENIFCSPFRVFGKEGRSLETQWNVAFGRDDQPEKGSYSWPKASLDAERWRYETIKKCQEALEQPTSEYDPRDKLKKGFETSLDAIKNELSETLGKVSDVDNDTVRALEDLARKAAKMWLVFGTQRCRILVDMSRSSFKLSSSDRIKKVRESFLELVLVPKLQRFGNSKGQDLDKEEKIADCEAVTEQVSIGNF